MIKTVFADRMTQIRTQANAGDNMAMAIMALFDTDYQSMLQVVTPAAKSANSVAATSYGDAASNSITVAASPASPRNVRAVFGATWDGGNIVVTGTDQFDVAVTETLVAVAGTTVVGTKIFKTVTSLAKSAVGVGLHATNTVTVGTGDKLGLTVKSSQSFCLVGDSTPTAMTPAAYDSAVNGFTPANVPDGSLTYTVSVGV